MTTRARLNKGRHKEQVRAEDGELITLPDHRTAIVYNMSVTGRTDSEIASHLGISLRVVQRELKLHRDTVSRAQGTKPWEDATDALIPKAVKGVDRRLEHDAHLALKFLYGKGILSDKQKVEAVQDSSPTPEQFKKLGEYARDNPAIGLILLQAMGIHSTPQGPQVNEDGEPGELPRPTEIVHEQGGQDKPPEGQGILSQGDGGTPGSETEEDV